MRKIAQAMVLVLTAPIWVPLALAVLVLIVAAELLEQTVALFDKPAEPKPSRITAPMSNYERRFYASRIRP